MKQYGIYVLPDGQGRIVAINSEGLLTSLDGWIRIDEYESDEPYAQGDYLDGPLTDERGVCRYKLEDGQIVKRARDEMDADYVPPVQEVSKAEALASIAFVTLCEAGSIDMAIANAHPDAFAKWESGVSYGVGQLRRYRGMLYRCVQAHTSRLDWTPDVTPALWVLAADPAEEWPEWSQPTGAHDAYMTGDKVSHNGTHWISSVDSNVWEPGVYGWTAAT